MLNFYLLFLSLATVEALQRAQLVPKSDFEKRVTYNGGWALGLAGSTCPSDAPVACDTGAGSVNPTCCPSGQTCFGSIHPYCCPSSADCTNVVTNFPVCANSTAWNLYIQANGVYFCCEPGQYGVLPLHGYAGICEPLDQVVASSLIATPASQAGGAAVVTSQVAGAGPTNTMTVTSTLKNGGITTITTAVSGAAATSTATSTNSAAGLLPSPSGGATATITLTRGAEIGIGVGAAVIFIAAALILWRCLVARKRKRVAAVNNAYANTGNQGQGMGAAPMYTPNLGQAEQGQGRQQQGGYMSSPMNEYKAPLVGVYGADQGVVSPNSPPPSNAGYGYGHGGQGNGNSNGRMNGRYEAPGPDVAAPVEAPNAWERGIRM